MHPVLDEHDRYLVPVALVQLRVVEDRDLLHGCRDSRRRDDLGNDIPRRIAQVTSGLREEGDADGRHELHPNLTD